MASNRQADRENTPRGQVHKVYDRARTPYQRLLALAVLDDERCQELERLYQSLNPLQLHRQIDQELEKLWRLEAVDPVSELAARIRAERADAEVRSGSR